MGSERAAGWRIGCAQIPAFALTVARRLHPEVPAHAPLVLIEDKGHLSRVAAVEETARLEGVRIGQAASHARACCAGLVCLDWDPPLQEQVSQGLAERLGEAAPLVVPVEGAPGMFWIDARGMRWLGGEDGLASRVIAAADAAGFDTLCLAIADTAVAARAAVQLSGEGRVRIVNPGTDAGFMATLPLTALDMDESMRQALLGLGLTTVAELMKMPPAALTDRFGVEGRAALERALGIDERRPNGRPPQALPTVTQPLDNPVESTAPLVFGLRGMIDRLASRLLNRGLSATRLDLILHLDDHTEHVEVLEPTRPLHHPRALFELCRERLERIVVDSPVIEIGVAIRTAQSAVPEQTHLGASRWDPLALEGALNRLHGRFGQAVVFTPVARDDPRPEAAGVWDVVTEVPLDLHVTQVQAPMRAPAPVRRALPAPEPLQARFDTEGLPVRVCFEHGWRPVRAHGPERLSGGWWDPAAAYAREDWRLVCVDAAGGVLWASRAADGRWWLRGWWD